MTPEQRKNNGYSLVNPYTRTQPKFLLNYCCLITIGINTVAVINPISISKTKRQKKNANELAECREMRLFNQHQYDYQKEKIICELADHIRQETGKRASTSE